MHGERLEDDRAEHRADEQLNKVRDRQELAQAKSHEPQLTGALLHQVVLPVLLRGLIRASRLHVHRLSPSAIARYASSKVAGRVYGSVRAPMRAVASPSARMR